MDSVKKICFDYVSSVNIPGTLLLQCNLRIRLETFNPSFSSPSNLFPDHGAFAYSSLLFHSCYVLRDQNMSYHTAFTMVWVKSGREASLHAK